MKFLKRLRAAYRLAKELEFTENDLPSVEEEIVNDGHHLPQKRRIIYYRVGRWSMEIIDPDPDNFSDGDPRYARDAILAWISWWRFLNSKPKRERKPSMSWQSVEALVGVSRGSTLREKIARLRGE